MNEVTTIADPATPAPAPGVAWRVANLNAGQAHGTLSNQWFSRPADQRFLNLDDLYRFKRDEFESSSQVTIASKSIEVLAPEPTDLASMSKISFAFDGADGNGVEAQSSHWAFNQLCGLIGFPAAHYREQVPTQLSAPAFNWGLKNCRKVDQTKVYYRSNGEAFMRALTGPDYGRIPDFQVVEALQHAVTGTPWKVPGVMDWATMIYDPNHPVTKETTTLFASDRDIFIFLVDDLHPIVIGKVLNPRTGLMEDDIVFRGFYITNSEVGKSSLKLAAFYLRAICCNRIMWGVEGFEELTIRHSKFAVDRWMQEAQPALESFANGSSARLKEAVERAKAAQLVDDAKQGLAYLKALSIPLNKAQRILNLVETEEGHEARSAWDFAQGITALARDEINNDSRLDLELTAKRILDKVAA